MKYQGQSDSNQYLSKDAVLDLLAKKLNCARDEVSFLFGQSGILDAGDDATVTIPDSDFISLMQLSMRN